MEVFRLSREKFSTVLSGIGAAIKGDTPANQAAADENLPVDEEFLKELKSNPFGTVVYYRVD